MSIIKRMKKLITGAAVLSMSLALLVPGSVAHATSDDSGEYSTETSGRIDTGKESTLAVSYVFAEGNDPANRFATPGVVAHIYKIADMDQYGYFTLSAPFDEAVDSGKLTSPWSMDSEEEWADISKSLKDYITANNVQNTYTATADANGLADIGRVDQGLYFGVSDRVTINGTTYIYEDFLVTVPSLDGETNWDDANYNVIVSPKRSSFKIDDDPDEYKVYKQWIDSGDNRPASISVKIYCDNQPYDTITLSDENNWQHSWMYEKGHSFTVEEVSVPANYTSAISRNGNSFIIVNTENPETPEEPNEPVGPPPEEPDNPGTPDTPQNVDSPPNESMDLPDVLGAMRRLVGELPEVLGARRLPQTGQLWWPIPVLAVLGVIFIGLGIRSEKRRKGNR